MKTQSKETKGSEARITLMLMSVDSSGIKTRAREYIQKNKVLIAVEDNDYDPPMGLRRVKISDLPKIGGILGTIALALDTETARLALVQMWKQRESRLSKELSEVQDYLGKLDC